MNRILIDGRFVGIGESVSRYTLEVLKGVLALDQVNQYTLLIRPQGEKALERYPEITKASNLKLSLLDIPHYSTLEQVDLLEYLEKERFDLVHFAQFNHPIRYKGKFVVTVHDLTLIGHLHRQSLLKRLAFRFVMKSAVKKSQKIISISEVSKQDILDYYPVSPDKIVVTYLGVDHERYNEKVRDQKEAIDRFKDKYGIKGDYILYTGMWKKHKNLARMLKAYERLISGEWGVGSGEKLPQLVLAGKIDQNEPEVIAEAERINRSHTPNSQPPTPNYPSPIVLTDFVTEAELPLAYAGALLYIIPSLSEGFGLPPLEAMACGTPVIASKESCIPEILGEAALFFDPYSVEEMAAKMKEASTDEALRSKLAENGLKQVQKYHWSDTAKETLEVYKEVLN